MVLFLLRHADVDTEALTDEGRMLSDKGMGQARKVARFCEAHELIPELIVSSPVRRAQETAQVMVEVLHRELITARWLACGMSPETALDELRGFQKFKRVMLVGHEPDFSLLATHLLGLGDRSRLRIRKASLTHIELPAFAPGAGILQFSLPCRLM
jgi:phosphohistidine phosphatase